MRFQFIMKRFIDVVVAAFALILLSPLMMLVAFFVCFSGPGPVFFVQDRVGLNQRIFKILKFRTMTVGASSIRNGLAVSKGDTRVTKVGVLLRKTSLDELPQFINVLKGDLSLVGPRPMLPEQLSYLCDDYLKRFNVRPGVTGLATISGRCSIPWSKRLEYDLQYVDEVNIWLDVEILIKTVWVVISGKGTYYDSSNGPAFDIADPDDLPQAEPKNKKGANNDRS